MKLLRIVCLFFLIAHGANGVQFETSEDLDLTLTAVNDQDIIVGHYGNELIIIEANRIRRITEGGRAYTINNKGQIFGAYRNQPMAYRENLGPVFFDPLAPNSGAIYDVNESGIAVGIVGSPIHAFSINGNTLRDPQYYYHYATGESYAYGINDTGIIVGYTKLGDPQGGFTGEIKAFAWDNQLHILGADEAENSRALDINNQNQIVGYRELGANVRQAILVDFNNQNTSMQTLIPEASYSSAQAINEQGVIVGQYQGGFLRYPDGKIDILSEKSTDRNFSSNRAFAINAHNTVLTQGTINSNSRILRPRRRGMVEHFTFNRQGTHFNSVAKEDRSIALQGNLLVYLEEIHNLFGPRVLVKRLTKHSSRSEASLPIELNEIPEFASFGKTLAVFGDDIALGAPEESNGGAVYIYHFDGSSWSLAQRIAPADLVPGDQFGFDIAVNQGSLLISAPQKGSVPVAAGAVYTFSKQGSGWQSDGPPLTLDSAIANDRFGVALDLDGDQVVIATSRGTATARIYTKIAGLWQNPVALSYGSVPFTHVAISGDVVIGRLGSNLVEFHRQRQWQGRPVGFTGQFNYPLDLQGDVLVSGGVYHLKGDIWYQIERPPFVLGGSMIANHLSGSEIIQARLNSNAITRYHLADITQPMEDADYQVVHQVAQTAELAQTFNYSVQINNLRSNDSLPLILEHSYNNATYGPLPAECGQHINKKIFCVIDNLTADTVKNLDFTYTPIGTRTTLSSTLRGLRDDIDLSNNIITSTVQNYSGTPGLVITRPLDNGSIIIPEGSDNIIVQIVFTSTFNIGSLSYLKVYINDVFYNDSTQSDRVNLGSLTAGTYSVRLELYSGSDDTPILINGIPLSAEVNFIVTRPFIEIIAPANDHPLQAHIQGEYWVSFKVDSLGLGRYIEWTLNGQTSQHHSLQPIKIPFADLLPGSHTMELKVMNGDGTPTGISTTHPILREVLQ